MHRAVFSHLLARPPRSLLHGASGLMMMMTVAFAANSTPCRYVYSEAKKDDDNNNNDDDENKQPVFDLTKQWERRTSEGIEYFQKWIVTNDNDAKQEEEEEEEELQQAPPNNEESGMLSGFLERFGHGTKNTREKSAVSSQSNDFKWDTFVKDVSALVIGGNNKEDQDQAMKNLIEQARSNTASAATSRDNISHSTSIMEFLQVFTDHAKHLDKTMQETFGHLDLTGVFPTSFYYYVEREDEIKNPSWKRRMHRFHRAVDVEQVKDLNTSLCLAELSYAYTVQEIKDGIGSDSELVYCDTDSAPGEPAHFIFLSKDQSTWSPSLEVTMVVRGTRDIADALTDAYLETVEYRNGMAHECILESGQYLVKKHTLLLENLCKLANKRKVKLKLVGHSLGAGAATIAGMEFNDNPMIDAQVVGFGCPSLLSKELSESTAPYVCTVIADADMIPRMNGATIGNMIINVMEYDWTDNARRDALHALDELQRVAPAALSESSRDYIMSLVDSWLETYARPSIQPPGTDRAECVLHPPGTCIHFFRDGVGITGTQTPCTFFGEELDVVRTMLDDHLIDEGYRRIFLELMRQYRRDQHFSFEEDKKK